MIFKSSVAWSSCRWLSTMSTIACAISLLVEVDVLRAFILELLVLVLVRFLLRDHCVPHLVQHNHQIIHSLRRLQLNVHRVQQRLSKARTVDLLKVNQKLLTSERSELKTKPSDNNNKISFHFIPILLFFS